MEDFELNGVIVSEDEDDINVDVKTSKEEAVKEEKDTSNNSIKVKTQTAGGSRTAKSHKNKKGSRHGPPVDQITRRNQYLEQLKMKKFEYDDHTNAFLNFLDKPHVDFRDMKSKIFKNQLMLSETMDEIPVGFAKNWQMVVCPVGTRCLVVASKGYTGAYTKTGYHIISHSSSLPKGNKMFPAYGPCILDCVYCNESQTYFVLDLMCWDGEPLYQYDTMSRFRLLQVKVREYGLIRPSPCNPYPFVPLKTFTPTKSNICGAIKMAPYKVDGLLFYHKQSPYKPGTSPLVLWLTLDRLPSKLKLEIPELGILAAYNYKDPVALALAHGVSPAIISQVYPHEHPPAFGGRQSRREDRRQREPKFGAPPFLQDYHQGQFQYDFNRSQGPYNGRHAMQGSQGHRGQGHDRYDYLSKMMMNLNLDPWQGDQYRHPSGQHGHQFFDYNMNNNYSGSFYGQDHFSRVNYHQRPYQQQHPSSKQLKKKRKSGNQASNQSQCDVGFTNWDEPHPVMKSQWMEAKPENFESEYVTCICPMAKRRIVVAAKEWTCIYNKYGKLLNTYTSSLPCGSSQSVVGDKSTDLTILDCLWCGSYQKFYVMDVMQWRQQPFYDAEAEFRFFWLNDKFTDVKIKSGKREFPVEVLPKYSSDKASILEALGKVDYKVDGLLCVAKSSRYSRNAGSDALWLKLDIMEELLGYAPPEGVTFKPSTEKERKQRAYFMGLNKGTAAESPAQASNSEADEDEN